MKRFKIIIFHVCIFLLFSCSCTDTRSEDAKIAHSIVGDFSQKMNEKYGVNFSSIYESGGKNGYDKIGLTFVIHRILAKNEGRKILINMADEFLETINKSVKFKPYLLDNPFTYDDISITIISTTQENKNVYYPNILIFDIENNKLKYYTKKEGQEFGYYTEEYETIEEAKKLVESQANNKS